jgi:hypothetical protein
MHHHHHHHHLNQQLSPDASPRSTNHLWPAYSNNNSSNMFNKCIMGLSQLRLIEFSGFLEKRRDPEIYHKHLFVHLNTADYLGSGPTASPNGGSISSSNLPSTTQSNSINNNNTSNPDSLIDDFEVNSKINRTSFVQRSLSVNFFISSA